MTDAVVSPKIVQFPGLIMNTFDSTDIVRHGFVHRVALYILQWFFFVRSRNRQISTYGKRGIQSYCRMRLGLIV